MPPRYPRRGAEDARRSPPAEPTIDTQPAQRLTARGVTFVVPAFDEEDAIEDVVRQLAAIPIDAPREILVVDDGSRDGTAEALERAGTSVPALRVIRHEKNRGYGAALKTGFASARHEVVVITDADGTYPSERVADLLDRIDQGAEMAVGARTGGDVNVPLVRRPAKMLLGVLASYLAGTRIPDLNSGMRALRRDLVLAFRPILPDGFSFTTTITLAALTNGRRVDWVSIDYKVRKGSSKIRPVRDTLGFASLIVRTVLYFNPLKVFFPFSVLIGLALLGSLYFDLVFLSPPNLSDKTVLLFVALVQTLSVGLLADLFDKRTRL